MASELPDMRPKIQPKTPHDIIFLLCEAVTQPPKYTRLIDLIDYDRFGVYAWSQIKDGNKWIIPLKDGSCWQATVERLEEYPS